MLTEILPPQYRKIAYAIYAVIGVVLGALQVAFLNLAGQPQWLTVALAVFGFVGTAFGVTAASNVHSQQPTGSQVVPTVVGAARIPADQGYASGRPLLYGGGGLIPYSTGGAGGAVSVTYLPNGAQPPAPTERVDQPRTLGRVLPRTDPRLGRHVEHDPRSRGFARPTTVDKSTWHTKTIRIYDPTPNPNQTIGNCTGVAKCVQFNAAGDRLAGKVLTMADAVRIYELATTLDDIAGTYPPDDTGSSGLAAAKAAQKLGLGGAYYWLFGGADEVVQAVMDGDVVNVGTRWDQSMMTPDAHGIVHPGGPVAGGHEWSVRGYDAKRDLVLGRCWWGEFRDFWISRTDLDSLLADQGDAHVQARA